MPRPTSSQRRRLVLHTLDAPIRLPRCTGRLAAIAVAMDDRCMSRGPVEHRRARRARRRAYPPLEGRLVGYRLLRRIASGERADVYLAAAESPDAARPRLTRGSRPRATRDCRRRRVAVLVVLRVYVADVSRSSRPRSRRCRRMPRARCPRSSTSRPSTTGGAASRSSGSADSRCSRLLTERTLSAGEAVTILAPVVVAVARPRRTGFVHTRLAATDILLDDAGRPRLIGLGALRRLSGRAPPSDRTAAQRATWRSRSLLEDVAAAVAPPAPSSAPSSSSAAALDARPFQPCEAELERRLFAAAAPEPVGGVDDARRPARLPARITAPLRARRADTVVPVADATSVRVRPGCSASCSALAHGPDELIDRVADAADVDHVARSRRLLGPAWAGPLAGRRRRWWAAARSCSCSRWFRRRPPTTERRSCRRITSTPVVRDVPTTGGAHATTRDHDRRREDPAGRRPSTPENAVRAAARRLLERRAECFETLDLGCLDAVVQPGSAIEAATGAPWPRPRGHRVARTRFDPAAIEVTAEMGAAVLVRAATRRTRTGLAPRGEGRGRMALA